MRFKLWFLPTVIAGLALLLMACSPFSSAPTDEESPENAAGLEILAVGQASVGGRLEFRVIDATTDQFWLRNARLERFDGSKWVLVLRLQTSISGGTGAITRPGETWSSADGALVSNAAGLGPVQGVELPPVDTGLYRVGLELQGSGGPQQVWGEMEIG